MFACETGWRWHATAPSVLARFVATRTPAAPTLLRRAAAQAFHRRWWSIYILSVSLQCTVATSLFDHPGLGCTLGGGPELPLADILCEAREPMGYSRLAMRG